MNAALGEERGGGRVGRRPWVLTGASEPRRALVSGGNPPSSHFFLFPLSNCRRADRLGERWSVLNCRAAG